MLTIFYFQEHEIVILFAEIRVCVKKWAYLSYARISAGTNARLQIAGLLLFPGCHWSIQKVMSYVKLSLFKTKTKYESVPFH